MRDNVNRLIGKQVAKIRREKGFTQAQLAESLDVATETISRLERGVSIPSLKTLENISLILNIKLKDLFDFEYPQKSTGTAREKEIAKLTAFLKQKKAEEIKLGYNVLKSIFDEIKLIRKSKNKLFLKGLDEENLRLAVKILRAVAR
ncbi:MAG: hypothetical protein A3G39_08865 [Deltaproteobacteria bacterium RIFCSPLOWO2_12_FULL_43_16]|nr:MAG: hypothetical protein A3A85_03045 [Deltaproteobacteria bacterium RIFCSPLOWO2_01_FULL_42_9]OGQ61347.1 MAG: hypothetical protein A3G39_08865 [Deltaproteobacteria bacterium RIFCSPLOWO2_12_FULL_43_16]